MTHELFISRLDELINMRHPLVRLAGLIGLAEIERTFSEPFTSGRGRPALAPRLIARLLYLQHIFDASDDAVVNTWIENPYWQYFCGELYLQTEAPVDPSSLTRWRKRIGEEGVETLLMVTIEAARRGGVVNASSVDRVIADTDRILTQRTKDKNRLYASHAPEAQCISKGKLRVRREGEHGNVLEGGTGRRHAQHDLSPENRIPC